MVKYRHRKRGTTYKILGPAHVTCSEPVLDDEIVYVFQDKTGELYGVFTDPEQSHNFISTARAQCEEPLLDGEEVLIYQDIHSNELGVRPREEFFDGRFEEIPD